MLKKYLEAEIDNLKDIIDTSLDESELEWATFSLNEINMIYSDICDDKLRYTKKEIMKLNRMPISDELMDFIIQTLKIYASMPLTETESPVEIPILYSTRNLQAKDIRRFWNDVLINEYGRSFFDDENCIILEPQHFKLSSGKCVIYHTMRGYKKFVTERYYNIQELIEPCAKAYQLFPEFKYCIFNNLMNITNYFIRYRAIVHGRDGNYARDFNKYPILIFDRLIIHARILLRWSDENNKLSDFEKAKYLDFIDQIIGYHIARNNKLHLTELVKQPLMDNSGHPNLDLAHTSYDEIIEESKKLALDHNKMHLMI